MKFGIFSPSKDSQNQLSDRSVTRRSQPFQIKQKPYDELHGHIDNLDVSVDQIELEDTMGDRVRYANKN